MVFVWTVLMLYDDMTVEVNGNMDYLQSTPLLESQELIFLKFK